MKAALTKFLEKGMILSSQLGSAIEPVSRCLFPESVEIDNNESVWQAAAKEYTPNNSLRSNLEVDIAVIGGGFTGVSTCYHLAQKLKDKSIILLEAKSLGNGATGRTAGLMLNWLVDQGAYSDDLLKPTYDLTSSGMHEMINIIKRHKLAVNFRFDGTLQVYTDHKRAETAKQEVQQLNQLGIPLSYIPKENLHQYINAHGACGAVLDPNSGQINGLSYVRELKRVIEDAGVKVFEDTPVTKLDQTNIITLHTPHATVRAKTIVLATNAYTGKLGLLQDVFFPLHSFSFATDKLGPDVLSNLGWHKTAGFSDDYDRISFSSLTPEGYLLFGGGSNATYQYRFNNRTITSSTAPYAQCAFEAAQRTWHDYMPYSKNIKIAHKWSGLLDLTMKRNLIINKTGVQNNIYYALGFCGHGVVLANIAGAVIADMYTGNDDKWCKFPFYMANYAKVAPEPFRWLGYQIFTSLTGRSPRV